ARRENGRALPIERDVLAQAPSAGLQVACPPVRCSVRLFSAASRSGARRGPPRTLRRRARLSTFLFAGDLPPTMETTPDLSTIFDHESFDTETYETLKDLAFSGKESVNRFQELVADLERKVD